MNPLKAFVYCAEGVPVVSTPIANLYELGDLITVAKGVDGFIDAIEDALGGGTPGARRRHVGAAHVGAAGRAGDGSHRRSGRRRRDEIARAAIRRGRVQRVTDDRPASPRAALGPGTCGAALRSAPARPLVLVEPASCTSRAGARARDGVTQARAVEGGIAALGGLPIVTQPSDAVAFLRPADVTRQLSSLEALTRRLDGPYALVALGSGRNGHRRQRPLRSASALRRGVRAVQGAR